jgi:hypothetical protein
MAPNSSYRDSPEGDDDPEDIRLKAFALLNRIGPDEDDDETTWPEKPEPPVLSPYQKAAQAPRPADLRKPAVQANHYDELGFAGILVGCIADACKKSVEYAAKTGYESIYPDSKQAKGDFEKVSILCTYQK